MKQKRKLEKLSCSLKCQTDSLIRSNKDKDAMLTHIRRVGVEKKIKKLK
jgi:hypothetical protein